MTRHPSGPNFDRTPLLVGEVQIDAAFVLGDADVDRAFRRVKLGARFEQIDDGPDGLASPVASPVSS